MGLKGGRSGRRAFDETKERRDAAGRISGRRAARNRRDAAAATSRRPRRVARASSREATEMILRVLSRRRARGRTSRARCARRRADQKPRAKPRRFRGKRGRRTTGKRRPSARAHREALHLLDDVVGGCGHRDDAEARGRLGAEGEFSDEKRDDDDLAAGERETRRAREPATRRALVDFTGAFTLMRRDAEVMETVMAAIVLCGVPCSEQCGVARRRRAVIHSTPPR